MSSALIVRTNRSAKQFARRHCGGILTTRMPTSARTASNDVVVSRRHTRCALVDPGA